MKRIAATITGLLFVCSVGVAHADVKHTVGRGHTLQAIANRYHVTVKAIMEANNLKDAKHLKVGDVLIIPGVGNDKKDATAKKKDKDASKANAKDAKDEAQKKKSFTGKPKNPGVVHLIRPGFKEELELRVSDRRGRTVPVASKQLETLMRSQSTQEKHPIDKHLVSLIGTVSDHFGGKRIEVISGYRPYSPHQYTKHSNHNHGKAIDFRVTGVPNEVVRDYCRTLHNTGCGYYPNSTFVHMDTRKTPTYWIDYSRAGEAPKYHVPNVEADEGTSDVHADARDLVAEPKSDTGKGADSKDTPDVPMDLMPADSNEIR
jgi:uncharacterized protein YcbK (DUF882 family)